MEEKKRILSIITGEMLDRFGSLLGGLGYQ
jgi:hypothetical protein